jgi:hypothetical protein
MWHTAFRRSFTRSSNLTAALMLPNGMPATAMSQHESTASTTPDLLMANPAEVGALRTNVASDDPAYVAAMRDAFYGDVTVEDFGGWTASLPTSSRRRCPQCLRQYAPDGCRPGRPRLGLRGNPGVDLCAQVLRQARRSDVGSTCHFAAFLSLTPSPSPFSSTKITPADSRARAGLLWPWWRCARLAQRTVRRFSAQ